MINGKRREEFHSRGYQWLVPAIAFFIPLYIRIVPVIIALLAINWLAEGAWIATSGKVFREKNRWMALSFSLLWLLYLAGMSYSSNLGYGWSDLETKLSLLILPLIFATRRNPGMDREDLRKSLCAFVAGCLGAVILLSAHALQAVISGDSSDAFFYSRLSWFNHPSYLAMYLSFAAAILAAGLADNPHALPFGRTFLKSLLILVFMVFTVMLSSKAGYLSFIAVILFTSVSFAFRNKKYLAGLSVAIVGVLLFYGLIVLFPHSGDRLKQAGQDLGNPEGTGAENRSTGERMAILKVSLSLARDHWPAGVGTGDVKDSLIEQYRVSSLSKVYQQRLNAHNQYLQTFIAIGLPGFSVLVCMLLAPAFMALRRGRRIYLVFLALVCLNLMFESMLESQAGVIYYAFFNILLFAFMMNAGKLRE